MTCSCERSWTDIIVVTALICTTLYSAHSFYAYLFPNTIEALATAFLHPFIDVSSTELLGNGKSISSTPGKGGRWSRLSPMDTTTLFGVKLWGWLLFLASVFLLLMDMWAYTMAVIIPPGRVPAVFRQRATKSSSLALSTFYEPLPRSIFPVALYPPDRTPLRAQQHGRLRTFRASADEEGGILQPGEPPADTATPLPQRLQEQFFFNPKANSYTSMHNSHLNYCPMCAIYKPPRTHHCSRCSFCVLKYDHHCPWLGQCVGFFNYKNYLLVLFYTWLLTAWVLTLLSIALGIYALDVKEDLFGLSSPPPNETATVAKKPAQRTGLGVGANIAEELHVGPPFFGVIVCVAQSVLFFAMTTYLLRRHFTYARHNITTIDIVIYESERCGFACSTSGESDAEGEAEAPMGGAQPAAQRARTLRSYMRRNIYDIGVQRNLLQVFGDAQLKDAGTDIHGNPLPRRYYSDLMEGDVPKHRCFVVRWFFRLLPTAAYPAQRVWSKVDMSTRSASSSIHMAARSHAGYGTMQGLKDGATATSPSSATGASLLTQLGVEEEQLLGLRFPTRSAMGLSGRDHP